MKFSFLSLWTVALMATTILLSSVTSQPVNAGAAVIWGFVFLAYGFAYVAEEFSQL